MRIVCISSKDSIYDVISKLKDKLEKEIFNTEVELQYVQRHLDIPAQVLKVTDADLVLVFVGYEELNLEIKTTMERLVDVDMKTDVQVMKAFEEVDFSEEEAEKEGIIDQLAEKWKQEILNVLFHPEKLRPGAE